MNEQPKAETVEEAAIIIYNEKYGDKSDTAEIEHAFFSGFKECSIWQSQQPLTEAQVTEIDYKLFDAFIHCLLISGAHTIESLRSKDKETVIEAYKYWLKELPTGLLSMQDEIVKHHVRPIQEVLNNAEDRCKGLGLKIQPH
jgi:hypothetical protein